MLQRIEQRKPWEKHNTYGSKATPTPNNILKLHKQPIYRQNVAGPIKQMATILPVTQQQSSDMDPEQFLIRGQVPMETHGSNNSLILQA